MKTLGYILLVPIFSILLTIFLAIVVSPLVLAIHHGNIYVIIVVFSAYFGILGIAIIEGSKYE